MSLLCPVAYTAAPALVLSANVGSSEAANIIESLTKRGLLHYSAPTSSPLISEIEQIVAESAETGRTDHEAPTIEKKTAEAAMAFSILLPRSLPAPEVAPEADGEISFDWLGPSGKIFSVSVNATGRLAYAGIFGRKSKVHGTEQLSNIFPSEIIQGISKAFK